MIKRTAVSMMAFVMCLGILSTASVSAQPTTGTARQTGVSEHHRMMADMMKDMSQEMSRMTEQMGGGERTPEQRKRVSRNMESMSKMMHRMSGLYSRPAMKEPEMQKQMDQMRKQMSAMKHDSPINTPAK